MSDRFHIIITGEDGRSSCFQFSLKKLLAGSALIAASITAVALIVITSGESLFIGDKVRELEAELARTEQANRIYLNEIEQLKISRETQIEEIKKDYEFELTSQKSLYDLENTSLKLENVGMLNSAIGELNSRSRLIESVMKKIGVEIIQPAPKMAASSGGPFIPARGQAYDELMKKVDEYLRTIRYLPLGKPVAGVVSSKFGQRIDPLNHKTGFHEGVDILGSYGDDIRATAAGVVVKAFKNGGYGNYVEIDHGNGYRTIFGHMKTYFVKKGDSVKRGQIIGQVGSSGRSTGPHLHYEIRLNRKPINPGKFLQVADLSRTSAESVQ